MKIIASDFDGTLNWKSGISAEDQAAIARFRQAGHKFGVVTGRDMDLTRSIPGRDGFYPDFVICCTGAVILDADGKILYQKRGRIGEFITDIIRYALSLGAENLTVSDGLLKYYVDTRGAIPPDLRAFDGFTQMNARFPTLEVAEEFVTRVRERHSDDVTPHRNGRDVDLPPAGTSKVTGIYEYAKHLTSPEIYTVGDNVNDLSMIREFYGFAVSNATEAVKEAADRQCNRVADMIDYILSAENE